MSHDRYGTLRPLASVLALTVTSGTLAGLGVLAAVPAGAATACVQPMQTFVAGDHGSYTVPAGASSVDVVASGASGAAGVDYSGGTGSALGGAGATVTTTLIVTPGQILDFAVGTAGDGANGGLSGTSPSGGAVSPFGSVVDGGGGGGATFVTSGSDVLVAAGGGGGGGYSDAAYTDNGGDAGPAASTVESGVTAGGDGDVYAVSPDVGVPATGGGASAGTGALGGYQGTGDGDAGNGQVGGNSGQGSGAGGGAVATRVAAAVPTTTPPPQAEPARRTPRSTTSLSATAVEGR